MRTLLKWFDSQSEEARSDIVKHLRIHCQDNYEYSLNDTDLRPFYRELYDLLKPNVQEYTFRFTAWIADIRCTVTAEDFITALDKAIAETANRGFSRKNLRKSATLLNVKILS